VGPCFGEEGDLAAASDSVGGLASCRNLATQKLQKVQTPGVFVRVVFDILPVKQKAQYQMQRPVSKYHCRHLASACLIS